MMYSNIGSSDREVNVILSSSFHLLGLSILCSWPGHAELAQWVHLGLLVSVH